MPERDPADPAGLGDIGALGLSTAAAVVERMLALGRQAAAGLRFPLPANGDAPAADGDGDATGDGTDRRQQARRFRADADRLIELYGEWTRTVLDGALSLAEQASAGDTRTDGALHLGPVLPGVATEASAWIHVLDGPSAAPAPLHASSLTAHDGTTIEAGAITFEPDAVDTAAPRTSVEVRLTITVPTGTPPGTYHGHLLAHGLAEIVLPVRLEVFG